MKYRARNLAALDDRGQDTRSGSNVLQKVTKGDRMTKLIYACGTQIEAADCPGKSELMIMAGTESILWQPYSTSYNKAMR